MQRTRNVPGLRARTAATVRRGLAALAWPTLLVVLGGLALPSLGLAAEGEGGGLIEINRSLVIQLINFLILLAVLYRFLYKPLLGALAGRSSAIKQQLAEAQAAREDAQRQLADFDARLRAAQGEAQAVRERAVREAAETRERLTAEARQAAARLIEAARSEIAQDVRRARGELRAEVGTLATLIAERLIGKSLRGEDHQRLVREALARIESS